MAEKTIKITLEDKIVVLTVDDGGARFDTEDILRIDYSNIVGELLTFPVIVNRIGILKAQADNAVRDKKFRCDIFEAELAEKFRKSLVTYEIQKGGTKKAKAPVLDAVNNAVKLDSGYQAIMNEYFRAKRNAEYVDSLYWSVKSKDDKLKALSHYVPKEFEKDIVEGVINGIKIKGIDKPFNSRRRS